MVQAPFFQSAHRAGSKRSGWAASGWAAAGLVAQLRLVALAPRGALWPALRANAMADDALLEVEVSGYTLHGDDPKTVSAQRPLDAPVSIDQPAIVSRTQLTLCVCVGPATRIARPLLLCDAAIPHIHGAPPQRASRSSHGGVRKAADGDRGGTDHGVAGLGRYHGDTEAV